MKALAPLILSIAAMSVADAREPLPAEISDGVTVEAAWIRPIPGDTVAELFLVVNNESPNPVTLSSIGAGKDGKGMLVSARGEAADGLRIPVHAELYMTEGGVRALVEGRFEVGMTETVQLVMATGEAVSVGATVIAPATPVPDHHDYQH